MSEFMLVDTPAIYPQACVFCGSAKGPLVDSVREVSGGGRGYLCTLCVKRCAKVLGLVKGPRMEELLNAGVLLDEASASLAERDTLIDQQRTELGAASRKIQALEELLAQERGRNESLRHIAETINESSRQLLGASS